MIISRRLLDSAKRQRVISSRGIPICSKISILFDSSIFSLKKSINKRLLLYRALMKTINKTRATIEFLIA